MNLSVLQLLSLIDSAQDETTEVIFNRYGNEINTFLLGEILNTDFRHNQESISNSLVESFLFCDECLTIEIR